MHLLCFWVRALGADYTMVVCPDCCCFCQHCYSLLVYEAPSYACCSYANSNNSFPHVIPWTLISCSGASLIPPQHEIAQDSLGIHAHANQKFRRVDAWWGEFGPMEAGSQQINSPLFIPHHHGLSGVAVTIYGFYENILNDWTISLSGNFGQLAMTSILHDFPPLPQSPFPCLLLLMLAFPNKV